MDSADHSVFTKHGTRRLQSICRRIRNYRVADVSRPPYHGPQNQGVASQTWTPLGMLLQLNVCHASVCGFRINLTEICQTATHESEYEHLPLLATGAPDMASVRNEFRSIGSTQHGPYFRGYCGEHGSEYQGTTQLAGASLAPSMQTESEGVHERNRARLDEESRRVRASIIPPRRTSLAYTRIRGPLAWEQGIIYRLQGGEGISGVEMISLFEKCTLCDYYFVASLLRVHIRGCAPDL